MPYADPDKQREYMRKWIHDRRVAWFADKFCIWCGGRERLELDHIDPSLKVTHRIWSWAEAKREVELAKCRVLCRPCHMYKSMWLDNPTYLNGFKHGTRSMYQKHKCRCEECRAWQSARLYRQRHLCLSGQRPHVLGRDVLSGSAPEKGSDGARVPWMQVRILPGCR